MPSSLEFQYSFAHIERRIISLQSDNQRLVFYIAKSIFYRWIKPINPDVITSFMLKNTMLWLCEEYGPENNIWGYFRETTKILNVARMLFDRILRQAKEHFMPYYFIPAMNVYESISSDLMKKMIVIMTEILNGIEVFIPKNTESVITNLQLFKETLLKIFDMVEYV